MRRAVEGLVRGLRRRADPLWGIHIEAAVAERGIRRVVCFHTDHFEPFEDTREAGTSLALVEAFIDAHRDAPHARRASVFLLPPCHVSRTAPTDAARVLEAPDDGLVFSWSQETLDQFDAVTQALDASNHDTQLHIHHETWTQRDARLRPLDEVGDWLAARSTPHRDARRFEAYLRHVVGWIGEARGRPFSDWGFVHGKWALNGSDRSVCQIDSEMEILLRHGCRGDFTFPAGRPHCDPAVPRPFACRPVSCAKGYDSPLAQPRPLGGDRRTLGPDRMFIWSSGVAHENASVDIYAPWIARRAARPTWTVARWFRDGAVIDGTLFVKTHAHSMAAPYWHNRAPQFPLASPLVTAVFEALARRCDAHQLDLEYWSVRQVMDWMTEVDDRRDEPR